MCGFQSMAPLAFVPVCQLPFGTDIKLFPSPLPNADPPVNTEAYMGRKMPPNRFAKAHVAKGGRWSKLPKSQGI